MFALIDDHVLQRIDRLEILRRDFRLRNREIELGFHTEHQVDHIHRRQADVHQQRLRIDLGRDRVLREDRLDESKDPVFHIVNGVHFLSFHLEIGQSLPDDAEIDP